MKRLKGKIWEALLSLTFIKMKKEISTKIEIPEGTTANLDGDILTVKGPEGEISKKFILGKSEIKIKGNEIVIGHKNATKNEKRMINTNAAHIQNMVKGVNKKFEYQLKICFGHFPFTVKQEGTNFVIKNFLGEKADRTVKLPQGVEVEIKKDIITVKSCDKNLAGQASANFEAATKIGGRDKRIFQDGVYIIEKDGKKI